MSRVPFRVGMSLQLRNPDATAVIPEFDLSPLEDDPSIETVSLPDVERLSARDLEDLDAVVLGLEGIDRSSFGDSPRPTLVARFGGISISPMGERLATS